VVLLICFEIVELHCSDRVIRQLDYRQHIPVDINTSDALHAITHRGKNDDHDWFHSKLHIRMRYLQRFIQ